MVVLHEVDATDAETMGGGQRDCSIALLGADDGAGTEFASYGGHGAGGCGSSTMGEGRHQARRHAVALKRGNDGWCGISKGVGGQWSVGHYDTVPCSDERSPVAVDHPLRSGVARHSDGDHDAGHARVWIACVRPSWLMLRSMAEAVEAREIAPVAPL